MAKIKPIEFPLGLGSADELIIKAQLHMEEEYCFITYELLKTVQPKPVEGMPVGVPFNMVMLNQGRLVMGGQDYQDWGSDNNYVIQWVANKLGVELL